MPTYESVPPALGRRGHEYLRIAASERLIRCKMSGSLHRSPHAAILIRRAPGTGSQNARELDQTGVVGKAQAQKLWRVSSARGAWRDMARPPPAPHRSRRPLRRARHRGPRAEIRVGARVCVDFGLHVSMF